MSGAGAGRVVWLVARREVGARLRTRAFALGTVVALAALVAVVLVQTALFAEPDRVRVGLAGQATAVTDDLVRHAAARGVPTAAEVVADVPAGTEMVADGELDVLVSGAPAALRVTVRGELDPDLRKVLTDLVQAEVLRAQLAAVEDLDPEGVLATVADATVDVHVLDTADPTRDQRLATALVLVALLYAALLLYGTMLAQGVVEEKSSRVVELLLATVRPWELLLGKVLGLGLVGLAQFTAVAGTAMALALATGALTVPAAAAGTLLWGLVWYLLGYLFYATVFAAAGALVSRQEETQAVLLPVTLVLVLAFALGFTTLTRAPTAPATAVLSVLPPLSPVLMPGRIAMGTAPAWQIALAVALSLAATAATARLGGRVYARAALRTGPRVALRDALRG